MTFRPPIVIDSMFDRPEQVRKLVEARAPYLPVQRYFNSEAEYRSSSGKLGSGQPMIIAPNWRGDWAYEKPLAEGVELFFDHAQLREAASELFESPLVRPHSVYSNLTWQLPFAQGGGHTDVPAFRGIERSDYPIWLLRVMGSSGLFENERIRIATAVAWFYHGEDGGFEYWPDGPDSPSQVHEGAIFNTAIMGDNDRMYHRVRPVGQRENGMVSGMTLDTRLEHRGGDAWSVVEQAEELAQLTYAALRISVSWKALVFRDAAEERAYDEHSRDLSLEDVLSRFTGDLETRGVAQPLPVDPVRDPAYVELLSETYTREPTVFAT